MPVRFKSVVESIKQWMHSCSFNRIMTRYIKEYLRMHVLHLTKKAAQLLFRRKGRSGSYQKEVGRLTSWVQLIFAMSESCWKIQHQQYEDGQLKTQCRNNCNIKSELCYVGLKLLSCSRVKQLDVVLQSLFDVSLPISKM